MNRLLVRLFLSAFLLASPVFGAAAPAPRPNFVFIIADDLGWADVAFHGGSAPTPNLDKLAHENLELTRHYVAPVCSPTRTGLMTGRFWSRFNVTTPQNNRALRWDTFTLPLALKSVGYDTCITGKWHLGSKPEWGPNHFGFDHSYGSLAGGVGPWDHFYKKGEFSTTWHRNEKLITEKDHVTDLITKEAVQWLDARTDKPFFLYLPFTAVHLPVKEPAEWLAKVPAAITGDVARHYAACIMHLDDAVGRIVATLEKAGKRDNTLLIFTSDNGGSTAENAGQTYPPDDYPKGNLPGNNKPLRGEKGSVYEGGIRVPAIASWPGKIKSGQCETPLHIADWMPTFCALAGYKPDKDLKWDGTNIWPALSEGATLQERVLYWTAPGFKSRALRVGDMKLVVHVAKKDGEEKAELYDLSKDPHEITDLAGKMPGKLAELKAKLAETAHADRDAVADD